MSVIQINGKVIIDGVTFPSYPVQSEGSVVINDKVFISGYGWMGIQRQKIL